MILNDLGAAAGIAALDLQPGRSALIRTGHTTESYVQALFGDPLFFLRELWTDRKLDKVAPLSDIEEDAFLFAAGVTCQNTDRGVLAFRGTGKTTFVTQTLSAFRLFRDVNRRVLIVSKSTNETKKTCGLIREWIDKIWFLQHLMPIKGARDAATYFDVAGSSENRQPSVSVVGIDGQLEGNRAHSIFPDDCETKSNTKTLEARIELERLTNEFANIRYPNRAFSQGGPIDPVETVYSGTPKHEESLYAKRIAQKNSFRAYPIAYPTPDMKILSLAPIIQAKLDSGQAQPGEPTIPLRFGREEIIKRESQGRTDFLMENMLIADLSDSNRYPLQLSDIMVLDLDRDQAPVSVAYGTQDHNGSTACVDIPSVGFGTDRFYRPVFIDKQWAPYNGTVMFIDSAGRGDDPIGVSIVSHLGGLLFVKLCQNLPGGFDGPTLCRLCVLARTHNARSIYVEHNFGRGMYAALMQPVLLQHFLKPGEDPSYPDGWAASIVEDTQVTNATGQKELRILAHIEPPISGHRVIFDRQTAMDTDVQHQLTRLTKQRGCLASYGAIDSLAGAFKAVQHVLRIDPAKQSKKEEDLRIDQQRKYLDKLLGRTVREPNWIHRPPR